jgi:hypothetical protein
VLSKRRGGRSHRRTRTCVASTLKDVVPEPPLVRRWNVSGVAQIPCWCLISFSASQTQRPKKKCRLGCRTAPTLADSLRDVTCCDGTHVYGGDRRLNLERELRRLCSGNALSQWPLEIRFWRVARVASDRALRPYHATMCGRKIDTAR